jgi:effector-binding domain-containing protein
LSGNLKIMADFQIFYQKNPYFYFVLTPCKMVKKILWIIGGLVVALVLAGFMLPRKVVITQSAVISAPSLYVFEEVNNLERHTAWSYWQNMYKDDMKTVFGDIKTGAGAFYQWEGEKSGKGKMTITESIPNRSVKIDLDFMEQGKALSWYLFEPEGNATKVTTGFEVDLGMNPFMRILAAVIMKPEMKKAFDYNLTHLKEIAEAKPVFTVSITEETAPSVRYIGKSTVMSFEKPLEVSAAMAKSYNELMGILQRARVPLNGHPFCLYPRWDESNMQMEMVCALPVDATTRLPASAKVAELPGGPVVKAIHMGNYATLGNTHDQIKKYLTYKNLEINGAPWEVYVTDPVTEPDTSKWITEVYYPVRKK